MEILTEGMRATFASAPRYTFVLVAAFLFTACDALTHHLRKGRDQPYEVRASKHFPCRAADLRKRLDDIATHVDYVVATFLRPEAEDERSTVLDTIRPQQDLMPSVPL